MEDNESKKKKIEIQCLAISYKVIQEFEGYEHGR